MDSVHPGYRVNVCVKMIERDTPKPKTLAKKKCKVMAWGFSFRGLRTFGGTPSRDPCSLWGLTWGRPGDVGVI